MAASIEFTGTQITKASEKQHCILFAGHMIDKATRKEPRFPASREAIARAAIKQKVQQEKEKANGPVLGIAGGACGGDILFHEACEELNIPTELCLALPRKQFVAASVQFAGPEWVNRFNRLYKKLPVKVLAQKKEDDFIWQRNNLWLLYRAQAQGTQVSLIALWDGKSGDGAGGTEHLVQEAQKRGIPIIIIDPNTFFNS